MIIFLMFQNTHKSIGSNDGSSNSGNTAAATATPTNDDNSSDETTRENGRGSSNSGRESTDGIDLVNSRNKDNDQHSGNGNFENQNEKGLNLKMSAKELRARLAARKKYDPKKESIGFKDKFDIVQKL